MAESNWMQFVKKHKHIRLPGGLLDLKAISKLYHAQKGYDPKILGFGKQQQWEKEPKEKARAKRGTQGQTKLTGGASTSRRLSEFFDPNKRCEPSVCAAIEAKGGECDEYDIPELIDSTLSCEQNKKNILKQLNLRKTDKYIDYAKRAAEHYKGQGKLINASPEERAAAFARMREDGTLRGYDVKSQKEKLKRLRAMRSKYLEHATLVDYADAIRDQKRIIKLARGYDPTYKISGKPRRWFDAMFKGIKTRSDVKNPYAVVNSIWTKLTPAKKASIKAREAKGEQFKYDLPLPDDRATRGTGTVRMVKPFKLAEVQVNLSIKDYLAALKSGLFSKMKRNDGTTALVARCKSPEKNVNVFIDKG